MGTHNIGFHGELTKIIIKYLPYLFFCGILTYNYSNANYCFYSCKNENFQSKKMWHFFLLLLGGYAAFNRVLTIYILSKNKKHNTFSFLLP